MSDKIDGILAITLEQGRDNNIDKMVEVIVRTSGAIGDLRSEDVAIEELLGNFAIIRLPYDLVGEIAADDRILEMNLSTRMVFNSYEENVASCIMPVKYGTDGLTGKGVLLAVIDSGLDVYREDFRNESGSRVLFFYDLERAVIYSNEDINRVINQGQRVVFDRSYHGTSVASIAAGSSLNDYYKGVANECQLLVVRLKTEINTADVMRGINFAFQVALEKNMPLVVNLSLGNSLGDHNGKTLIEQYIDTVSLLVKACVCVGVGNEGNTRGHLSIDTSRQRTGRFTVGDGEKFLVIQIWKKIRLNASFRLITPDNSVYEIEIEKGVKKFNTREGEIWIYTSLPSPTNQLQEIILYIGDGERDIQTGIFELQFEEAETEQIELYMENGVLRGVNTGFLNATPWDTMTIPSMAQRCISVAATMGTQGAYASFSGRGDEKNCRSMPNIAAVGVNVIAATRDGYGRVSGTSFATPILSGACALLMEWGIVKGNDLYLYGDRVKAYLYASAIKSNTYQIWPNAFLGNGQLCLQKALQMAYNNS